MSTEVVITADKAKVAVCEALLAINRENPSYPFIAPTAINWLGDALVRALLDTGTAVKLKPYLGGTGHALVWVPVEVDQ